MTEWMISSAIGVALILGAYVYRWAVLRGLLDTPKEGPTVYVEAEHPNHRISDRVPPFVDLCEGDPNRWQWRTPGGRWFKLTRDGSRWTLARLESTQKQLTKAHGEVVHANWITFLAFDAEGFEPSSLEEARAMCNVQTMKAGQSDDNQN